MPLTVDDEMKRRGELWADLERRGVASLRPDELRESRVYGGAQGVWVDKTRTGQIVGHEAGVTVSVLHTGRHYADDLSEDGVIYHYPQTNRGGARDAAEVEATKSAGELEMPLFVILPGSTHSTRAVRLGWVADWDDGSKQFLILFGPSKPNYTPAQPDAAPFSLFGAEERKRASVRVRVGQQRFRFQVLKQYGAKCAVCSISHTLLLHAAHLCGKAAKGSDDWRNGVPLCATHHVAFDADLFAIHPDTLQIVLRKGVGRESLGISVEALSLTRARPHVEALRWRFGHFTSDEGREGGGSTCNPAGTPRDGS